MARQSAWRHACCSTAVGRRSHGETERFREIQRGEERLVGREYQSDGGAARSAGEQQQGSGGLDIGLRPIDLKKMGVSEIKRREERERMWGRRSGGGGLLKVARGRHGGGRLRQPMAGRRLEGETEIKRERRGTERIRDEEREQAQLGCVVGLTWAQMMG